MAAYSNCTFTLPQQISKKISIPTESRTAAIVANLHHPLSANSQMAEGYSRTRTYYFRRCKNSFTDCVPDEVLYEILLRFSAQDIFSAMLVCKKWYQMVCSSSEIFIRKHLEHSSYGLLCQTSLNEVFFISARKVGGGIDTIKLNYSPEPRVSLWSSCNGLVLESDLPTFCKPTYYVRNVLSHQVFRLPQCPYTVSYFKRCVIGYDATSMKYKVVVPIRDNTYTCCILTVGVDKSWRILSIDNLSDIGKTVIRGESIVTEGFMHWKVISVNKILTLNLETEIFVEAPTPITMDGYWHFSSGRYLTLFNPCGKYVWEVLEMKPETKEWKKLPNICLEGLEGKIIRLGINFEHEIIVEPSGWLKYPELLALIIHDAHIIFYNVITCEVCAETLPISVFILKLHFIRIA